MGNAFCCAFHPGGGFRGERGLATRGYCFGEGLRLATFARRSNGECAEGDAFFEECWGVEMKISLRESSTFAKVRRVKGV